MVKAVSGLMVKDSGSTRLSEEAAQQIFPRGQNGDKSISQS